MPLGTPAEYTKEEIQRRAEYAEARLQSTTRKPTPNTIKALTVYKAACEELHKNYDNLSKDDQVPLIDEIRSYDDSISKREWLRENPTSSILNDVLLLRRYSYWARYADWAEYMTKMLRKGAKTQQSAFAKHIPSEHLWTDISAAIKKEERECKANGFKNYELVPKTYAVYEACTKASILFHPMIDIIHGYAAGNEAFHSGLEEMLDSANFAMIAQTLHDDLNDLGTVCPPDMSEEEDAMRAVLLQIKDEWFDSSFRPFQPASWNATSNLQALVPTPKSSNTTGHQKALQQSHQSVALGASHRLNQAEEEILLLRQANDPRVTQKDSKRKARTDIDVNDRRKAWQQIQEIQMDHWSNVRRTLVEQRNLNRVVSGYREEYGSFS